MSTLASLKLTAAALVLLGAGVTGSYLAREQALWAIAAPLVLLAVNLAAAVVCHPALRRQRALLVFHVALALLAVLAAGGQLMSLKGRVELTSGAAFAGELLDADVGPLHPARLDRVWFVNEGFEIDYAPDLRRGETRNRVRWRDEAGVMHVSLIGDQTPLVLHGYRFYTSPNKGFAALFTWQGALGSVHLPSFPAWRNVQSAEWTPPGETRPLALSLHLDEALVAPQGAWRWRVPERYRLEVEGHELRPGTTIDLASGRLRFEGLGTWMGYQVFADWTLPWMLAAASLAAASLAWHFWRRLFSRPW